MNMSLDEVVYEPTRLIGQSGRLRFCLASPAVLCGHACTSVLLKFREPIPVVQEVVNGENEQTAKMKVVAVESHTASATPGQQRETVKCWQEHNVARGIIWIANNIQQPHDNE